MPGAVSFVGSSLGDQSQSWDQIMSAQKKLAVEPVPDAMATDNKFPCNPHLSSCKMD